DTVQLPVVQDHACRARLRDEFRYVVNKAGDEAMTPIKIRWPIVGSPVELIARDRKQLIHCAARVVIIRLAVRVSAQELQTATEALRDADLKRVVIGVRGRLHLLNAAGDVLLYRERSAERRSEHVCRAVVNRLVQSDHL